MTGKAPSSLAMIAAILAVLLGFYFVMRQWMRRILLNKIISSSITMAHLRYFEKQKNEIQLFFFGACEFNSGIDPRQFKCSAFNFSAQIASYPEQYYFLRHYIGQMPSIKALVLSLGDNSFCSYAATGATFPLLFSRFIDYGELLSISKPEMWLRLLWYKWLYSTDLGTLHYGRKFFAGWFNRFIGEKKVRIGNMKQSLIKRWSGAKESNTRQATPGEQERPPDKQRMDRATADGAVIGVKKHFSLPVFDERALFYFEKILTLCKEKNIPVITVTMPRSKYFLGLSKEYMTEELLLERIVKNPRYENLIYKHISYLSIYRDRDDLFYPEGALLNADGRKAFSAQLVEDISRLIDGIAVRRDS